MASDDGYAKEKDPIEEAGATAAHSRYVLPFSKGSNWQVELNYGCALS